MWAGCIIRSGKGLKCKYRKIFNKSENVRRQKHFWHFRVRIATMRTLVNYVTLLIIVPRVKVTLVKLMSTGISVMFSRQGWKLSESCWHIRRAGKQVNTFLTSTLDGGEFSTSYPDCFATGREHGYLLRRRMDVWKKKIHYPNFLTGVFTKKNCLLQEKTNMTFNTPLSLCGW